MQTILLGFDGMRCRMFCLDLTASVGDADCFAWIWWYLWEMQTVLLGSYGICERFRMFCCDLLVSVRDAEYFARICWYPWEMQNVLLGSDGISDWRVFPFCNRTISLQQETSHFGLDTRGEITSSAKYILENVIVNIFISSLHFDLCGNWSCV